MLAIDYLQPLRGDRHLTGNRPRRAQTTVKSVKRPQLHENEYLDLVEIAETIMQVGLFLLC